MKETVHVNDIAIPLYVAMVGYEKFVANIGRHLAIQRLLARSTMG